MRVEVLSRFLSPGEASDVVDGIADGSVDVVIGTHRLLSTDVRFKDLGLLVIDEEQRFGVQHKERIKALKADVDVLTLTATPIPRTLELSLTGIRDLSLVNTPPVDRQPILTYVGEYDERAVAEAIRRELLREGQVFFVHNQVKDIEFVAEGLRDLVPEARIGIAHGQMDEGRLERVVLDFWERQYDVLVCTTIVESGLDIPSVNTLVVDRADRLWNSSTVAHQTRWNLDLPDRAGVFRYLGGVLARQLHRLGGMVEPPARYFYELSIRHEDMHVEALAYTRQTLGYARPEGLGQPPTHAAAAWPGDVDVPGGAWRLGSTAADGFIFDNEKWAHEVDIGPFRIAKAPVTNAEFAAFVDAGGYRNREFWSAAGWAWRERATSPAPETKSRRCTVCAPRSRRRASGIGPIGPTSRFSRSPPGSRTPRMRKIVRSR